MKKHELLTIIERLEKEIRDIKRSNHSRNTKMILDEVQLFKNKLGSLGVFNVDIEVEHHFNREMKIGNSITIKFNY